MWFFFFFQAEDGIRDVAVTGVQTCALPILLSGSPLDGNDLITLLGNLIDNALDAAVESGGERRVEVSVTTEDGALLMRVHDSGAGVPPDLMERIFVEGFTTKVRSNGRRRGFGLTL